MPLFSYSASNQILCKITTWIEKQSKQKEKIIRKCLTFYVLNWALAMKEKNCISIEQKKEKMIERDLRVKSHFLACEGTTSSQKMIFFPTLRK